MTTAVPKAPIRRGRHVWLSAGVVDDLKAYRRGDELWSDTVARLIRFAKRYAPAAEAHVREEFLP